MQILQTLFPSGERQFSKRIRFSFFTYSNAINLCYKPLPTQVHRLTHSWNSTKSPFQMPQLPQRCINMLEDHMVLWMRHWQWALRLHGEQGAESIHNIFNNLERIYSVIQNPVQRMKNILREHHQHQREEKRVRETGPRSGAWLLYPSGIVHQRGMVTFSNCRFLKTGRVNHHKAHPSP